MSKLKLLKDEQEQRYRESEAYRPDARLDEDVVMVSEWAEGVGAIYEPKTGGFVWRGAPFGVKQMGSYAWRALGEKGFSEKAAQLAFRLYANMRHDDIVSELRRDVPLIATAADTELRRFVAFMTGTEVARELDVVVFKLLIWQIKRRIHGLPTEWEMMPLFTGGQGFGKTRHLERLWASIPGLMNFVAQAQRFSVFNDPFGKAVFNRCFIIPFDEMSGAKTTDMETLKMFITAHTVDTRGMQSEEWKTLKLNASFYGTSNVPGAATLSDSTGMRRFWEFKCPDRPFEDADGELLDSMNLRAVWDCVDAGTNESPVRPFLPALRVEQGAMFKAQDSLSQFFEDCVQLASFDLPETRVKRSTLHKAYVQWCQEHKELKAANMSAMQSYVERNYGGQKALLKLNTGVVFVGLHVELDGLEVIS